MATLPVLEPLNDILEINYKMVGPPNYGAGFIGFPQFGEVLFTQAPVDCDSQVCPPPTQYYPSGLSISHVEFLITDFVGNSGMFALFNAKKLTYQVQNSDLPPGGVNLNTSTWIGTI